MYPGSSVSIREEKEYLSVLFGGSKFFIQGVNFPDTDEFVEQIKNWERKMNLASTCKIMDFKLTSKYQHSKRLPNGTRRSLKLYFLNDILIFKQKLPFDETAEYGYSKWHISNEYLLNGKIYQTRFDENKSRNVSYPVSQKNLIQFNIPKDLKISKI